MTIAATAALLALVVGCAAADGGGGSPVAEDQPLIGRTFLSETVTRDGVPVDPVAGTRIRLTFPEPDQLSVSAGCNTLLAEVRVEPDRLHISGVGGTEMGCDPQLHDQDEWLADFLEGSPTWQLDADTLTLRGGSTMIVLRDREVADPDRSLAGTRWLIDTIISGETASSLPAGAEGSAWLVIEAQTFRASSGCRDIEGRVTVDQQRISFHDVVQTDQACPADLVEADGVVTAVLSAEVAYAIEAGRLRLDHPDGLGLGLAADE